MQIIFLTPESVEEYEKRQSQTAVAAPPSCPNCGSNQRLQALGYYHRYVTRQDNRTPRIAVRRFRCTRCRRTVSFLPGFAQPYKLVASDTIEAFMAGDIERPDVGCWYQRLVHYRSQFTAWAPRLLLHVKEAIPFGRHPHPHRIWNSVMKWAGNLTLATSRLIRAFGLTLFGEYKCHLPNPP